MLSTNPMDKNKLPEVPRSFSLLTFLGMFAAAMFFVVLLGGVKLGTLIFAPLFPLGLAFGVRDLIEHFRPNTKFENLKSLGEALFVASYAVYIVIFVVFCSIRKWKWYWVTCTILACLLLLNISGCHELLKKGFRGPE